jgi:hypothetical protein
MSFYMVDVEADGPTPGLYSMLSLGLVRVTDPIVDRLYLELQPMTDRWLPAAVDVSGLDRQRLATDGTPPAQAMTELRRWVDATNRGGRPVLVSDNPAFDGAYLNYYLWAFDDGLDQPNPFGHSARRLGDLWAGLHRDAGRSGDWRSLKQTPHTHNALDDATGNAEALLAFADHGLAITFE